MGCSHIPMPSFTLVLTSERVIVPGRSTVIRFDTAETKPRTASTDLMKTIDLRDERVEDVQFSFNAGNESGTILGHNDPDTYTIFEAEKRPSTSRGHKYDEDLGKTTGLACLLTKIRGLFPIKSTETVIRKVLADS